MKYDLIYADPPWSFSTWSSKGQGRAPKYPTLSFDEIIALPVSAIADENCALFLWTLGWIPPQKIANVIDAWGFKYKTLAFDWWKVTREDLPRAAKGYYTRSSSEQCILATKGKVPVLPRNRPIQAIIDIPTKHSAKPLEAYRKIEQMYPSVRKIELFARKERKGWTGLGNELDGMDIRSSILNISNKKG